MKANVRIKGNVFLNVFTVVLPMPRRRIVCRRKNSVQMRWPNVTESHEYIYTIYIIYVCVFSLQCTHIIRVWFTRHSNSVFFFFVQHVIQCL